MILCITRIISSKNYVWECESECCKGCVLGGVVRVRSARSEVIRGVGGVILGIGCLRVFVWVVAG